MLQLASKLNESKVGQIQLSSSDWSTKKQNKTKTTTTTKNNEIGQMVPQIHGSCRVHTLQKY